MDEKWTAEEKELWDLTQEFYVALDKLIRGMQLYQGKGGLVDRLLEELMKRADKLLIRRDSTVKISVILFYQTNLFQDNTLRFTLSEMKLLLKTWVLKMELLSMDND